MLPFDRRTCRVPCILTPGPLRLPVMSCRVMSCEMPLSERANFAKKCSSKKVSKKQQLFLNSIKYKK